MAKEKCLFKWRDNHGIWRTCQKKKGHLGKHSPKAGLL